MKKELTKRDIEQSVHDALLSALKPKPEPKALNLSPEARKRRVEAVRARLKSLLSSTNDPNRKERIMNKLKRMDKVKLSIHEEIIHTHAKTECCRLSEIKYKPFRNLTEQEMRVDYERLNEEYNDLQTDLEDDLSKATREEIERALQTAKNKIDAGDIAGLAALAFLFREAVREIMKRNIKASYDVGKFLTADEIEVERPSTPLQDTQLMNMDSDDISEAYAANLENTMKSSLRDGIQKGAATVAILAFAKEVVTDEAAKNITNISGTTIGQYINQGRNMVLHQNIEKIVAFQRSEILDGRTCAMCLALDELVVSPSDPMARMTIVHTHCRGQWVPILAVDEVQPEVTGIPATISNKFDKVDGVPVTNMFKQIKKPVNDQSKDVAELIKKKLKS